jgi:hexokinase
MGSTSSSFNANESPLSPDSESPLSTTTSPSSPPSRQPTTQSDVTVSPVLSPYMLSGGLAKVAAATGTVKGCIPTADPERNLKLLTASYGVGSLNSITENASSHLRKVLATPHDTPTMIPSCITVLPSGEEAGNYLSVDLGGSTFRVAFVKLMGRSNPADVLYKSVIPVPDSIKQSSGREFFLWMAQEIKRGVETVKPVLSGDTLQMGLSWSFPFTQFSMDSGIINKMGKGYLVADEITGWDLKDSFESAFRQLNLDIRVAAVVNDGTACMISRAYSDPTTKISLILGTGINAGVMLPLRSISPEKQQKLSFRSGTQSCLVNTEISMLGDGVIPETCWDIELDSHMEHPGFQPLETKVSGRYLGEISRLIIRDMILHNALCDGCFPDGMDKPYGLASATMSEVEEHFRNNRMDLVKRVLSEAHPHANLSDADVFQICSVFVAVSTRSAGLTAAVLVALADILFNPEGAVIPPTGKPYECTIAFIGTVIERYPHFRERCQQYLDILGVSRGMKLRLEGSGEDGSLLGPVIAAGMME